MEDKIKEILDDMLLAIRKYSEEDFEEMGINYKIELTYSQLDNFYDYITNLQEENEMYKKEKDALMNSLFITRNKYNNDKARYIRKAKNYKTRIYKAIKLLKDIKYDLDIEPWSIYQVKGNVLFDLLNLLQGEQNE